MSAALDFATLPPEINSGRMYTGAGSGPLLAAASAWSGLAAELRTTAMCYDSILLALTSEGWRGPSSAAMAAAAAPYVAWVNTTAAQAEQTAAQTTAAVAAYETAYAATVPPPVIAENRAGLMALVATNFLGQNAAAIAAAEAEYTAMWAQDALAMYSYAGSSAAATQLSPFTQPDQITNPAGLTAQSAAVTQAAATSVGTQQNTLFEVLSALPNALQELASPPMFSSATSGLDGILNGLAPGLNPFASGSVDDIAGLNGLLNMLSGNKTAFGQLLNANIWNTIFGSGCYLPSNTLGPFMGLLGSGATGSAAVDAVPSALEAAGPLSGIGSAGSAVSAGLGTAPAVGTLSVPPSWTAAAPVLTRASSGTAGTPMIAPPAVAAGMPPVPFGNLAGQGYGRGIPQYGFRPTFIARPPAGG
jgi:PPE-repeat protein